jgi:hypothetical protein
MTTKLRGDDILARPGQVLVLVLVDHGQQVLAAGDGLLAFHLGAETAAAGPGISFEHLYGLVTVLQGAGDRAARVAGDEPGQGAASSRTHRVRLCSCSDCSRALP